MNHYIVPSAFLIALLLTFIFMAISGRGPWRAIFLFFFIIFLVSWAEQLWITPLGPVILGVSLLPLIFVGVIFSFLIIAMSPPPKLPADKAAEMSPKEESVFEIGMFFWFVIVILITAIAIGYYKITPIADGIK